VIRFNCKNCGQGIKVNDQYAGRKGKCPKCGGPIDVPATAQQSQAQIMKFRCPHCSQKIGLLAEYAGKQVRCAKCKQPFRVPQQLPAAEAGTEVLRADPQQTAAGFGSMQSSGSLEELLAAEQSSPPLQFAPSPPPVAPDEPFIIPGALEEDEKEKGKRELPWPIDIFLYPASLSGLLTIGVIVTSQLVAPLFCCMSGIIQIIIGLYMYWFFCECVRDSANGGIRAPETIGSMGSIFEMFWQFIRLFACFCFFFSPVLFYASYSFFSSAERGSFEINNILFFSLLTYGIFFFPMGVLSLVMFDSVKGLNPILLVRSILSAFFQYFGLVILFYGLYFVYIFFVAGSSIMSMTTGSVILGMLIHAVVSRVVFLWFFLIAAHLLGRFYWRYEDKLYWEV
jgi:DNA-directed RNA polymerase subunit RPC12/RpoP